MVRFSPLALFFALAVATGCADDDPSGADAEDSAEDSQPTETPRAPHERVDSRPPPMHQPVDLWEAGAVSGQVDAADAAEEGYVLIDLGEEWTPYLFTEQDTPQSETLPNTYRSTYLTLARGEIPDDHHGERARRDKYLELYGIMPTLGLLRTRMGEVSELECASTLDLQPFHDFDGFLAYRNNDRARADIRRFGVFERQVEALLRDQGVESDAQLDESQLSTTEARQLRDYRASAGKVAAIRAAQDRLECEGFFEGKGRYTRGALDWATHEALAEFERRHRVYGWGFIGRDTLDALRETPMENSREAVIRVLTERAMHSAGVIEDGSTPHREGETPTFEAADGTRHPIPNLEADLRERIIAAFGLSTPESTLAFLEGLGELGPEEARLVAIGGPELPEYYRSDMDLTVEVDRGDVWYDFPYDEEGNEISQPVARRPRLTIFTRYNGHRIPLARFGTTIGGWRSESVEGTIMWKYKGSPPGPRVWSQVVAAPVWLPPESTPARDLLRRVPGKSGQEGHAINYHEMGPSYASAYGLVAAYHRLFTEEEDGSIRLRGDEGIRTHGSVDYMSIMRRHSHGCHRLHNHIAVRLMSFVLAHRPHRRVGQQSLGFGRNLEHEGYTYHLELTQGGYVFQLERPVHVNVLEGRIRGQVRNPIEVAVPKFNRDVGAYLMPDGQPVSVDRWGRTTPIELPAGADAGVLPLDGFALPLPPAPTSAGTTTTATPTTTPGTTSPPGTAPSTAPTIPTAPAVRAPAPPPAPPAP